MTSKGRTGFRIPLRGRRAGVRVRCFVVTRVRVRVRARCFVVTEGHKGMLCVRQCCGRRKWPSCILLESEVGLWLGNL